MSCISLRLPPARKIWKSFTSTLGKLHKIHRSKAKKKPRKHIIINTATTSTTRITPKFLAARRFRCKRSSTAAKSAIYSFHKKPAPVYIDNLFKGPSCDLVVKHLQKPQQIAAAKPQAGKNTKLPETSKGGGSNHKPCVSDDMWESLALASPLMQGIDERAEEFITRFRQEMVAQEIMLARNL